MTPKEYALNLMKRFKTNDPFKFAEMLNVILVVAPLIGINGFYQYHKRNHIIYLNETLEYFETFFVLAHELGHLIMHREKNAFFLDSRIISSRCKYERQANSFAVEMLMSDKLIREEEGRSIYDIARMVGVPSEFVDLKKFTP